MNRRWAELQAQCRQRRRAPLPPDEFAAALESKGFTNGKCDRPLVADLYRAGFAERFAAAARASHCCMRPTAASFPSLLCTPFQCACLPLLPCLDVSAACLQPPISSPTRRGPSRQRESVARLLQAVLEFVDLGWGGAEAAAIASLMAAGALAPCEKLSLNWNGVGDEGAAALAAALPRATSLRELHLDENGVGDRGVEALAAAVAADDAPASLARLSLRRHAASEAAAVALGAACAAKGVTCVL